MSGNRSLNRLLALLIIVSFLVSPQTMAAQDTVTGVPESSSQAIPEEEGNPGEGNPEEGNLEEDNPEEGNPEDIDPEDGSSEEGSPEDGNPGDFVPLGAPENAPGVSPLSLPEGMTEREYYCDFTNQPSQGSVANWWSAEGVSPDCIDFDVVVSDATCSLTVSMSSWVFSSVSGKPSTWNDSFAWYETDSNGVVLRPEGGGSPLNWASAGGANPEGKILTATFPEDYKGGTAYVLVNFGSPERDIRPGLSEYDISHWRTTSSGVVYEVNTDCELPPEGYFCDYSNHTGAGSVYDWLAGAPEGANTDCIDIGDPIQACGQVTIPFTETVEPFDFWIEYVEGTNIAVGTPKVATDGVISFPEDYNGGSVTVTAYIGGPEQDWVAFANEGAWAYTEGGVQFTIDTDCIDDIPDPGLPTPIEPAVCQQSLAGHTVMTRNIGVTDRVKVGGATDGEVNADGWGQVSGDGWSGDGQTMRLYAATRHDLTNVQITYQVMGGGDFGATYNSVSSPGVGNLPNDGYTVAVDGAVIAINGNIVTVTIASMPANSSISFNVPVTHEEGQSRMYVHSWMIGDLVDCEQAVLALPEITESVCDDNHQATQAKVVAPANSESVTYSDVTAVSTAEGITFTFKAVVNHGFTLEGVTAPAGWTIVSNAEATYSVTLKLAECEVPLKVATPAVPVLVPAVCNDANEPVDPTLTVPVTEGVTYSEVIVSPANSVKLSLTATANEGFTFAGADLPEGWTLVSSSEVMYEIVADTVECPTPEEPKEEKPQPVTKLPETGTGSNPAPMIALAASAAAAIAGAGLFVTNRKR